jgi:hypothetical protein
MTAGAREMLSAVGDSIGSRGAARPTAEPTADLLHSVGYAAVRRRFSPEFVNRIDVVVTYEPLDAQALGEILDHQIAELEMHVQMRIIMTTGTELSSDESDVCERQGFPVIRKPYLPEEIVSLVRDLGLQSSAASGLSCRPRPDRA